MEFSAGDIVLIRFPYSDGKGFKKRPALVLKGFDDGDLLLCRITSKIHDTSFDNQVEDWSQVGLLLNSVIRVHKLIVIEAELIGQQIGKISPELFLKVSKIFSGILIENEK